MSINRQLILGDQESSIKLEVDSFNYVGKVNKGYDIDFVVYAVADIEAFVGSRFDFDYGGKGIVGGSIRGYVKEVVLGYDSKQKRSITRIKCRSVIGSLADCHLNKMYSDISVDGIIKDILGNLCDTGRSRTGSFEPLAIQSKSNQLLNGRALDFFNYQFNHHGFYIVDDSQSDKDVVNVYSQPNDLEGSDASYDVSKVMDENALSGVENFRYKMGKAQPSLSYLGYDLKDGIVGEISNSPFSSGENIDIARVFYGNSFEKDDNDKLTSRVNLSLNSLNGLSELNLKNITHREGDVITLVTNTKSKEYWVYSAEIVAKVEGSKHWDISTKLEVLELTDTPWYAPLVKKPNAKIVEGFKYSSELGLGKYSSLPIETTIPFNNSKKEVSFARSAGQLH